MLLLQGSFWEGKPEGTALAAPLLVPSVVPLPSVPQPHSSADQCTAALTGVEGEMQRG